MCACGWVGVQVGGCVGVQVGGCVWVLVRGGALAVDPAPGGCSRFLSAHGQEGRVQSLEKKSLTAAYGEVYQGTHKRNGKRFQLYSLATATCGRQVNGKW